MNKEQEKAFKKVFPLPTEWQPTPNEPVYDLDIRRKEVKQFLAQELKAQREKQIAKGAKIHGEMIVKALKQERENMIKVIERVEKSYNYKKGVRYAGFRELKRELIKELKDE